MGGGWMCRADVSWWRVSRAAAGRQGGGDERQAVWRWPREGGEVPFLRSHCSDRSTASAVVVVLQDGLQVSFMLQSSAVVPHGLCS